MTNRKQRDLPLVYSCSGCSNVAQLANDVALELANRSLAQMSCIAGVGGDVPGLVRLATSGRPILALDGCPLACVQNCLARHGVEPSWHLILTDGGLRKREGERCDEVQRDALVEEIAGELAQRVD